MPKVNNREDDRLLRSIKQDIVGEGIERSYQLLDDGTLVVHIWSAHMINPTKTYRINLSIGREMKPSEWKKDAGN